MPRGRKRGRKSVQATKTTVDGIKFASSLEAYCYRELKKHKLFEGYENETFILLDSFFFQNSVLARCMNGKGEYKERGMGNIRKITYTPDFLGNDFIIEVKGRANESFPLKWKLFKKLLKENNDERNIYKPQNQKEVDETIRQILDRRKENKDD